MGIWTSDIITRPFEYGINPFSALWQYIPKINQKTQFFLVYPHQSCRKVFSVALVHTRMESLGQPLLFKLCLSIAIFENRHYLIFLLGAETDWNAFTPTSPEIPKETVDCELVPLDQFQLVWVPCSFGMCCHDRFWGHTHVYFHVGYRFVPQNRKGLSFLIVIVLRPAFSITFVVILALCLHRLQLDDNSRIAVTYW